MLLQMLQGQAVDGHGVWINAALFPDRFAAIAPGAGWQDFWTYTGASYFEHPQNAVQEMLNLCTNPSRPALLADNYKQMGVLIIHGDADPVVPIEEAYAMRDLLAGFERAGHRVRLVMEDDDHKQLTTISYLKLISEFEPELVVIINHGRDEYPHAIPANVPCVVWIQDKMKHLFEPDAGARMGELDFAVGAFRAECVQVCGYPAERFLFSPILASAAMTFSSVSVITNALRLRKVKL